MSSQPNWQSRIENDCLFVDDLSLGRVILQHNARPGLMPYIHPLRIEGGRACLTEDSPWHHPHQHGIQLAFTGVNGCDFWHYPGQRADQSVGLIQASQPRILSAEPPSWRIETVWRHKDGSHLLAGQQDWSLSAADELVFLDLDWTVRAISDSVIKQYPYGGLFIRMPWRKDSGASVVNANGLKDDDTEQQPAAWLDLFMPLEYSEVGAGITACDHPDNPGHPVKWRVDGSRGINPSPCIKGDIELSVGEAMRNRYRLILHSGPLAVEQIEELWATYAAS
ncbi:MAG: PmoA family protein [Chloroflexota bacterium]